MKKGTEKEYIVLENPPEIYKIYKSRTQKKLKRNENGKWKMEMEK